MDFTFLTSDQLSFGRGTAQRVPKRTAEIGQRVLLVRGRSVPWADDCAQDLTSLGCTVTQVIQRGEPDVDDVDHALAQARAADVQVVLGVGGGAVLDLAKAVAALTPAQTVIMDHLEGVGLGLPLSAAPLPVIAVPTTAGTGAEVTKNAVIAVPEKGVKVSLRDPRMMPVHAVVDPALTDNCPRQVTLASGLDAITQCIEPMLSLRANPMTDALAREGLRRGLRALKQLSQCETPVARDDMAFASLMGGMALANAGLGAVHGLAAVIGGQTGAAHGLICGRLLGPVLVENQQEMAANGLDMTKVDEIAGQFRTTLNLPDDTCVFTELGGLLDLWHLPRLGQWVAGDEDKARIVRAAAKASSTRTNPCVLTPSALGRALQAAC